jgi:hypothetical protein
MGIVEGEIESTGGAVELSKLRNRRHTFERLGRNPSSLRPLSIQDIKESIRFADLCTTSRGRVDELLLLEGSCLSASGSIFWEETSSRDCSRRSNIVASKISRLHWLYSKQQAGAIVCLTGLPIFFTMSPYPVAQLFIDIS